MTGASPGDPAGATRLLRRLEKYKDKVPRMRRFYVVAELGINHLGSVSRAEDMIEKTAEAGADAVKFQFYDWPDITQDGYDPATAKLVQQSQLTLDQLGYLKTAARNQHLEFVCTPFKKANRVKELAALNPYALKVRYKDFYESPEVLLAAMETGCPRIFVSCSAPPIDDPRLFWHPRLRFLHCIPKYPPLAEDFDLARACSFHGFSDHYPDIKHSLLAAEATLQPEFIIEKHVMQVPTPGQVVPDLPVSISFKQLAELVRELRSLERLKPEPAKPHYLGAG